jgi:hypothetical protein
MMVKTIGLGVKEREKRKTIGDQNKGQRPFLLTGQKVHSLLVGVW